MTKVQTTLKVDEALKDEFAVFCKVSKLTMSTLTEKLWSIHMKQHPILQTTKKSGARKAQ